jgi:hypothetical protein
MRINRQLDQANLVYGVFAVVIVLLSWLYLSSQLVLYAAEVSVVLARRLWPRSLLQQPADRAGPAGADGAGPDRGPPARAAGRGHLRPRGRGRRRPARGTSRA